MRVTNQQLYEFIAAFGKDNSQVSEKRMLAVLKARFGGNDNRQLIDRLEDLLLVKRNGQCITIKFLQL